MICNIRCSWLGMVADNKRRASLRTLATQVMDTTKDVPIIPPHPFHQKVITTTRKPNFPMKFLPPIRETKLEILVGLL